jgi:hypothetical protein
MEILSLGFEDHGPDSHARLKSAIAYLRLAAKIEPE